MRIRIALYLLFFLLASAGSTRAFDARGRLADAYPQVASVQGDKVIFTDGTSLPWDDGEADKGFARRLTHADIQDMFTDPYPVGGDGGVPAPQHDPGRYRNMAFFKKVYGGTEAEVAGRLAKVPWPCAGPGHTIRVTTVNGVDRRLAAVGRELMTLPENVRRFVDNPSGGWCWRPIAGTDRLSAHSFGIAVDIDVDTSAYWRWDMEKRGEVVRPDAVVPYRNQVPSAIVVAFERQGFIWGGAWHHYDTMHFEYRPELLPAGSIAPLTGE